jgi:hypothetical protein
LPGDEALHQADLIGDALPLLGGGLRGGIEEGAHAVPGSVVEIDGRLDAAVAAMAYPKGCGRRVMLDQRADAVLLERAAAGAEKRGSR